MGFSLVLLFCVLLLMSYFFDITASKTKIPSIILLILSGLCLQFLVRALEIEVPNLSNVLPVLGTLGLILIVLEGSLELELSRKRLPIIVKSFFIALFGIIALVLIFSYILYQLGHTDIKLDWINAIPLCIISSAIAIPTVSSLGNNLKQFIIYESSLSDIFGVIIFNFLILNEVITNTVVVNFFFQILIMLVLSVIVALSLAFAIAHNKHHVKFLPIILTIILIYFTAKKFHLPALVFILIFGLVLKNLGQFKHNWFVGKFDPDTLIQEVKKFTEITAEFAFAIRSIFFILFGFLIDVQDLINLDTLPWSAGIVVIIFVSRLLLLKLFNKPITPLLSIAPRGLITILLFLSIPASQQIAFINSAIIIQVIILCTLVMMIGMMLYKEENIIENVKDEVEEFFDRVLPSDVKEV